MFTEALDLGRKSGLEVNVPACCVSRNFGFGEKRMDLKCYLAYASDDAYFCLEGQNASLCIFSL